LKQSSITLDIVKNLRRGRIITVRGLNSNNLNIKKRMITMVGQRMMI